MKIFYRIAAPFSGTTLGVYLMHIYMLRMIIPKYWPELSTTSLTYRIPVAILVFILAALITRLLQRIPVLKRIVPG